MEIIVDQTDRIAEVETLRVELASAQDKLMTADAESVRFLKREIQQIQRDIQRNIAILEAITRS